MEFTKTAMAMLLIFWILQAAGGWVQWRHYQLTLAGTRETWRQGFLGIGKSRRRFGFGAVAMVVASPELRVHRLQVMQGMSVFARFKQQGAYEGMTLHELRASLAGRKTGDQVAMAIEQAIERIEEVRART